MTFSPLPSGLAHVFQLSDGVNRPGEFASSATGGPRFYVRASAADIRVVDRDYCHRDICTFITVGTGGHPIDVCRRLAAIRCAELNAWHMEQMQDVA